MIQVFVVPKDCPVGDVAGKPDAWRPATVVREDDLLLGEKFTWTCSGCTVGLPRLGEEVKPCLARKCELGG